MVNFLPLLQGRDLLVLGLGASGLAMARWCAKAGARVTVADTRAAPPQAAQLAAELPDATLIQSAFDADLFQRKPWAMVCRSPGIAPVQLSGLAQAAQAVGVPVVAAGLDETPAETTVPRGVLLDMEGASSIVGDTGVTHR